MNARSYRLVFSKRQGMYVPVSEVSRSHAGKRRNRRARLAAAMLAMLAAPAWAVDPTALPTAPVVTYGNINFDASHGTAANPVLNINQATQNGIIHWNSFNIGANATVNFNQPNVTAATLNRITGNEASVIQGAMNATGAVYVINRNGILFDKGAQVNLHTLVASTLDIKDDELFKNGFLTANPLDPAFSDAYTQYVGSAPPGMVNVAEGAAITAASGGRVILLAPDVENKGIIKTESGQVILAAGHKAYFHLTNSSDSNTLLRGLLVEVESGGSAVNLGELAARQGDVTLIGKLVKQNGVVTATTSANLNGTIHLLARHINPDKGDKYLASGNRSANETGSVEIGAGSRSVILPELDTDKVKAAIDAGALTQARVDAYLRGEARIADFYAYLPDTTLQDAQTFNASQIKAEGHDIWVQNNALLLAPSGAITLYARQDLSPTNFLFNPNDPGSFALNGLCLDCRLQIDDGAILDVSGLRDVAVAMERNVVEVELRGSVLADSTLLHDPDGVLYGKKIKVDIRDSGKVDINGQQVQRQGTTLVDASSYIAQIGRKVDEKSTTGGKVNLYSEGALVVQQDATIDLSGGSLAYQTGSVATSQLLYQGRLYDVATAKADLAYEGLGQDLVVAEQGYREGKDAGTLNIVAPWSVFQGDIKGSTVIGERQRGQGGSALPKGATLKLGIDNPGAAENRDYRILSEIRFATLSQSRAPDHGAAISDDLKHTLVLDAAKLKAGGISHLVAYTNNGIRIESGQTLDMGPGGSVSLTGATLDIQGDIQAPGGNVMLAATSTMYNTAGGQANLVDLIKAQGVDPAALDQRVTVSGHIVTAGLWTNDYLDQSITAPVMLDGGNITITSQGLLRLEAGSLLDASAGAWLKRDGKTWLGGKGGDITLTDNRPLGVSEPMVLAGELRSHGVLDSALKASRGGKLSITTQKVKIGGTRPDAPQDAQLWLGEGFFQQGGFSDYAITGINGLEVADNAVVAPRTLTRVLGAQRLMAASGSSLAGFANSTDLSWGVAKAERPTTHLSLFATSDEFGRLRVGKGAHITLDPKANLNLTAVRGLTVEGTLDAAAGYIGLELKSPVLGLGYLADAAIWLGESARISAQGVARTYTSSNGQIQGEVLDGGSITLLAHNGYIVAESGSTLDVSGAEGTLTLPKQGTTAGYANTLIGSAGGSMRLAASEGLFLGADLKAAGGTPQAQRGSLSIELDRPDIPAPEQVGKAYLTGLRSMELYAGTEDLPFPGIPAYLDKAGELVADGDNGRAVLDASKLGAFDHVNLKSRDRIVFEQSLSLAQRGRLSLDTSVLETADEANVTLNAQYVSLGNADPAHQSAGANVPAPTAGDGILTVNAGLIDLVGNWALTGAKQANLNSDGDIRLMGVIPVGDTTLTPVGHLTTAGDLALKATQVYPTTLSEFTLESVKLDPETGELGGKISLLGNGMKATVPLSAGGALTVKAAYIDQGGVLRAPLGKIELDASKTLTLNTGSLTSVSAEGQLIPYGKVVNGQSWVYSLNVGTTASERSIFSGPDGVLNLPVKDIMLKGETVTLQAGVVGADGVEVAPLDLSGGGDLYGYEFTPGPGGSSDYLAASGVFAIMPANPGQAAPFDFQYAQYAYSYAQGAGSPSGRLLGTGASQLVKPGDSVYLSDIPALNIKAGYYTLLPGHYALLPGAVSVRAVANTLDMTTVQNTQRTDGSYLVAGYRSSLGSTDIGQTRWSGFEVATRDVVASRAGFEFQYSDSELKAQKPSGRSEIHDYAASRLIPGIAALYDLALPKFGLDAGRLGIEAAKSLTLDGAIDFSKPTGALGGELDIASVKIAVTDGSESSDSTLTEYLVLDVDKLASYDVDSLMLGGTRAALKDDKGRPVIDQVKVNQVAQDVWIKTSAEHPLEAPEIMLVSEKVTLADNSVVRGAGEGGLKNETLVFGEAGMAGSGDGVLVRASSGKLRGVVRREVSSDGGGLDKGLYTGGNASVYGEKSVNLDATYTAFNLGKVELGENAGLQLGAKRVALGEVDKVIEGVFVTNALLENLGNPDDVVLKSYSNFDVYGNAALGSAEANSLSFEGAGFASLKSGQFDIQARNVSFSNPDGGSLKDVELAIGGGTMNVLADNILFGTGQAAAAGFAKVNLTARGDIAGVARDAGKLADGGDPHDGLAVTGDLGLTAQRITGYNGSDVFLKADGLLTTARYELAEGETRLKQDDAPLGGRLALTGASVSLGGDIELPAGWLSVSAESGGLTLLDGARIFTGGVVRQFKGVKDTVQVLVAGGFTSLEAKGGDLVIADTATVDVSGLGGADAGRLAISVPNGSLTLKGELLGTTETTATVSDPWQGSISLDVTALDDGDETTSNELSSLLQHLDGFGAGFSLRQRDGDLVLAANTDGSASVKAKRVVLSADQGSLEILGKIDAQSADGGWVVAAAGREVYLRNDAEIDAQATGVGQRGGEVWLISGMDKDYVNEDKDHGALVLENGSKILVGGTLPAELRFAGNTPGGTDIVLRQATGGRVHLQAPRLADGKDVRITQELGVYDNNNKQGAIGSTISGAALVEALGNKVFSSYTTVGTTQINAIKTDTQTYMNSAADARSRLGGTTPSNALHVRPGVEVRSSGNLVFANDTDFGALTFGGEPGVLTLRAQGKLLINGNLSDGFNSATGSTLDSGNSWSYRLVAGADMNAADPMAAVSGGGDFVLKGGKLIRTGTGAIQIAAGGDVEIGLNNDGSHNRASVIYTAGRADTNPAAYLTATDKDYKKVAYGVDGGVLSIVTTGSIRAPEFGQLTNNWLQRRGTLDSSGDISLSPAWGIAYEYFNQGVGALGGGNVRIEAGQDIENLSVSLPTTGRDYAAQGAGSKLFETGGGNAEIVAGGDIRGSFLYVQKGSGRLTAGGAVGAMPGQGEDAESIQVDADDNRNLVLAMGDARMQVAARNGLALETVFNPTVAATGKLNNTSSKYKSSYNTDFFTYGESSAVHLVSAQGDILLSNSVNRLANGLMKLDVVSDASGDLIGQSSHFVYPGSLTAAALNGSLRTGEAFALYPSRNGQLHLLAHKDVVFGGGVAMSDVDPARLPNLAAPYMGFDVADRLLFTIEGTAEYHAPYLTHLGDADPVRVYAEAGNIQYELVYDEDGNAQVQTLHFPKQVEFLAGRDIRDVSFTAQHVQEGQTSTVWAGRDVGFAPLRNAQKGYLANNGSGIQLGGPGYLNVVAGRNTDLGSTKGIITNGNLQNPVLSGEGAHITLLTGMGVGADGRPRQPAYTRFAALYLQPGSAALSDYAADIEDYEIRRIAVLQPDNAELSYAEVQEKLADADYRAAMKALVAPEITLAQAAFEALPLDVRARRIFYHELEMAGREANQGLGYTRGDQAIAAFFPNQDKLGNKISYGGSLTGFFSQIRTNQGGDIELLTPGGAVSVGLISNPSDLSAIRTASELGLFTVNGGSIHSYSRDSFAVNTSRVFTLGQEKQPVRTSDYQRLLRDNILLFSLLGDIDAGKGAKTATAAPPPTYEYDNKGNLKVNLANSISGSGIGVLLAREVIVPGDVSLIAPSGAVSAGDAGIRASGNLNIAAARVIGADNIQVSGLSIGVPVAVDTGGLSVSGLGNLGDANQATGEATRSLANASEESEKSAQEMKKALTNFKPSFITVEVLGFGEATAAVEGGEERRRKAGENPG